MLSGIATEVDILSTLCRYDTPCNPLLTFLYILTEYVEMTLLQLISCNPYLVYESNRIKDRSFGLLIDKQANKLN